MKLSRAQLDPPPVPAAGGKELPFLKVFVKFSSFPLRKLRGEHVGFAPAVDDVLFLSASHQQPNSEKRAEEARAATPKEHTRKGAGKR